jgi:hypothetical protein
MPTNFRVSSLIPTGLIVDSVTQDGDAIIVTAHARAQRCALCVARRRSAFTADISGRSRTSLAQGGVFAFASWHGAFAAGPRIARDRFSPNASTKPCSPRWIGGFPNEIIAREPTCLLRFGPEMPRRHGGLRSCPPVMRSA